MTDYIDFIALNAAVEIIADWQKIAPEGAWKVIRRGIETGDIKARGRSRRYHEQQREYIDAVEVIEPKWMSFLAYAEFKDGHLRFDPDAAIASIRGGHEMREPPDHVREVEVDESRLDMLDRPRAEWPSGREAISFREAAIPIEPFLPAAPISERYKIVDEQRRRAVLADRLTEKESKELQDDAAMRGDFEAWVEATRRAEESDNSVRDAIISADRAVELPKFLVALALSLKVRTFHPTLGLKGDPDEDWCIDQEGFEAISLSLLNSPKAKRKQKKKPGPPPDLRNAIRDKMLSDLRSERRTVEQLDADTLDVLVTVYGGSRNTANASRLEAIALFQSSTESNSENL